MLINISYKSRMYPNKTQQSFFNKGFGCRRKIWNLLLNDYINNHKIITSLAPYKEQYTYLKDADSNSLSWVYKHFTQAIDSCYKIPSRGIPRFKKKNSVQSYTTSCINNNIRIEHMNNKKAYIRLPKIGYIRLKYHRQLPYNAIIKHVTVTKTLTNEYYVSINITYDNQVCYNNILNIKNSIGLDYSLNSLIISDNNINANYERLYKNNQYRLAKYQSLRDKASKNSKKRNKFTMKIRKLHQKISNKRYDYLHKLSHKLVNTYDYVFIENIDLINMANKHGKYHLGKSIYDNSYGIFKTLLNYKLINNGKYLCVIDKYYPSTQLCSYCGYKNTLLHNNLNIRIWRCPICHTIHNRDNNAAINIRNRGIQLYDKYIRYMSLPIHDNISLNEYILNINKYTPLIYPVLREIVTQVPRNQRKIHIVEQVPVDQRKIHIVDQVPIDQRN